ncbi:MAG: hypothetical protein U9Q62_04560 [Campylobacterota bacterium]|nr:hypothetical protein [Campylobacterota bacterium]
MSDSSYKYRTVQVQSVNNESVAPKVFYKGHEFDYDALEDIFNYLGKHGYAILYALSEKSDLGMGVVCTNTYLFMNSDSFEDIPEDIEKKMRELESNHCDTKRAS